MKFSLAIAFLSAGQVAAWSSMSMKTGKILALSRPPINRMTERLKRSYRQACVCVGLVMDSPYCFRARPS